MSTYAHASEAGDSGGEIRGTLRRLAIFNEGLVEAGFGPALGQTSALDAKTAALLMVAASVATGSSEVCLQRSTGCALAAGATKDEIADVLLAIIRWRAWAGSSPPLPG